MYTFKELRKINKDSHIKQLYKEVKRLKKIRRKSMSWQDYSKVVNALNQLRWEIRAYLNDQPINYFTERRV